MPTLNKLEYLDETKEQIKDALNTKFNSQIQDDDTFRSYVSKIANIYNNWPKVSDEETEFTLSNTKKGKMLITPKGNTSQISYTGKNYLDTALEYSVGYSTTINGITFTINDDKTITANGTVEGTDNVRLTFINHGSILGTNKRITTQLLDGTITGQVSFFAYDSNYENSKSIQINAGGSISSAGLNSDITYSRFRTTVYAGTSVNNAKIGLMITDTSETNLSYEPYVGGLPSPNSYYPQDVKLVKGNNTITIGDGTNSTSYSLNLGSIELCKLDTYQDYIYKDSGNWYKKAYVGKVVLDGSEEWEKYQLSFFKTINDAAKTPYNLCNYFINTESNQWISSDANNIGKFSLNHQKGILKMMPLEDVTLSSFKTWLSTHNTIVYYVLAAPTDTQITDTNLIEQLETKFMSYDDTTNISSEYATGNAQMIISASALMKGGNSNE